MNVLLYSKRRSSITASTVLAQIASVTSRVASMKASGATLSSKSSASPKVDDVDGR